ncbi:PQQ-dependent sugar dehydrogenase [Streptoalloteichus hindustanus]|uniref:Glucose/arabinose dehydrogenase, beta-propeller fold n=1 Tax=Streptoalloteichus hindustanus TaxID=2017 RepID=A0A1M5KRJ7_STRHI|nr:PQQ-dependent sugar dehydrogenase [Streptoalloteichus hindustanus]SHG55336.1 Glucose/arabinose dehydrogenase, beta-propeller fold [Streptoalloteichus hindustanus]
MSIRRSVVGVALALLPCAVALCAAPAATAAPPPPAGRNEERTLAGGLVVPWGIAFLPDGTALVTERGTGRVLRVSGSGTTEAQKIQDAVAYGTDGGLLGIAVSPDYASDGWVFVYYTTNEDNRIARFRLGEQPEPVVTGISRHLYRNGGQLAFGPDGMLYAGVGDAYGYQVAQDRNSLNGKILRMTKDGQPAPGNPFPGSLVYSLGHRNVQGLTWDREGNLYAGDIGESNWDEVNRIQAGGNYGWPVCEGYCENGEGHLDPVIVMRPEEGVPSGLAYRDGYLYISTLRGESLMQAPIAPGDERTSAYHMMTARNGRLRAAAVAPDGTLWVTTSNRDNRSSTLADDDDRVISMDVLRG